MPPFSLATSVSKRASHLLALATILAIAAFLFRQIHELDIWWHLAIGHDILARYAIPTIDIFSIAGAGRHYHDSHWLFQVAAAVIHGAGGMVGIQLFMVLIWGVTLWFCYRSMDSTVAMPIRLLLLFLTAMAASERFRPRPELFTYLMIAVFIFSLRERTFLTRRGQFLIGLFQVIWTNSHGLFVLGPFMVLSAWLSALLDRWRGKSNDLVPLSRLLLLCMFATIISPYGWGTWRYAWLLASEMKGGGPAIFRFLGELSPTMGFDTMSKPAFWFFAALFIICLVTIIFAACRGRIRTNWLLMVAGMALLALSGRRNMVLFALVASPFICDQLAIHAWPRKPVSASVTLIMAAAVLFWGSLPVSGIYYTSLHPKPTRFGLGATSSYFPYGLPAFLDKVSFRGPIYNCNLLGGFYLFHGYPELRPLFDGRWEVYDPAALDEIMEAAYNKNLWQKILRRYDFKGILLHHDAAESRGLLPRLAADPMWRLVYLDYAASFWMRIDQPALPPTVDPALVVSRPDHPVNYYDCLSLGRFLYLTNASAARTANLNRALTLGVKREFVLELLGGAYLDSADDVKAEAVFTDLLRQYPNNAKAMVNLAVICGNRGNLSKAEMYLNDAILHDPDNATARSNLTTLRRIKKMNSDLLLSLNAGTKE